MHASSRLGILTGGGDCPGLNALIRAVVKRGTRDFGWSFVGIENGWLGLVEPDLAAPLDPDDVRGILPKGGTILGTSNKADPFRYPVREGGRWVERDVSDLVLERAHALGLDAVIAVGGDGTLSIGQKLFEKGLKVVGCPKTIDNDLFGTDQTFGFDTARAICTEAVDRLHTTAESHERVMILEVMGRWAGFLALHSGLAGGADVILIPEIPYRIEPILETIRLRARRRRSFTVAVVAEGAHPIGELAAIEAPAHEIPGRGVVRLGGAGRVAAALLADRIDAEIRVTTLGHLQRGGSPSAADRLLATRFGCRVLDLVAEKAWGRMVGLRGSDLVVVPLSEARKDRRVDPSGELVRFAKSLGIGFGD